MTRSHGLKNWVRERKFLLPLCSSFWGFRELCLLCLTRWAGCQWSKTSWWEGDGKCPGKGKAPLLIWPCWRVHGVALKSHVPCWPLSSHYISAELKAYRPFLESNQYIRIPLATSDSQDTSALHPSQLRYALALPWKLHGHPGNVG